MRAIPRLMAPIEFLSHPLLRQWNGFIATTTILCQSAVHCHQTMSQRQCNFMLKWTSPEVELARKILNSNFGVTLCHTPLSFELNCSYALYNNRSIATFQCRLLIWMKIHNFKCFVVVCKSCYFVIGNKIQCWYIFGDHSINENRFIHIRRAHPWALSCDLIN